MSPRKPKEGLLKKRIHETANKNMSDVERFMGGAVRVSLESVDAIIAEVGAEFHELVDRPYPKVKAVRKLVKKIFGDAKHG